MEPTSDASEASNTTPTPEPAKEDLYKKFNLKPSAEVGIRVSLREKKEQQERDLETQKAVAEATETEAAKINRLFAKLQLGPDQTTSSTTSSPPSSSSGSLDGAPKKKSNDAWKFLFDEDDLDSKERPQGDKGAAENKEMLDRIPGASDHFPSVSEHRSSPSATASTSSTSATTSTSFSSSDRWKDPKQKAVEKDAFKALFASLFEHNRPKDQDASGANRVQSLFSNFNRSGLPESSTTSSSDSLFTPLPFTEPSSTSESTETPKESPMAILSRQLKSLSERSEPIYLDRKPKTSSFQVMESTVGPQDWMNRDTALPSESNLFTAIREENKVAIRMRKDLEEKQGDITKVKDFVDELIAPFLPSATTTESLGVKPSGVGLDSLLAQAIMYASSTKATISEAGPSGANGSRSLHPWMGHAMVEHARRQGLAVFIRTVRTESYKALLQSRWNAWQDGPGCLEILKEMQRSGALVDAETRSLVRGMIRDLKATSSDGSGWGYDEQAGPLKEMLDIIKSAEEDRDQDLDARPAVLAGSALGKPMLALDREALEKRTPQERTGSQYSRFRHKGDSSYNKQPFRENRY